MAHSSDVRGCCSDGSADVMTLVSEFLEEIQPASHIEELISCLPDVNYFAKDRHGRFMMVDDGFVALLGCSRKNEVLGKTDFDFFSKNSATKFVSDDAEVMKTGRPLRNLAESLPNADRTFSWWMVNKVPVRNRIGEAVGIAGIIYRLSQNNAPSHYSKALFAVLEYIGSHYSNPLAVKELAAIAGLSERALTRNFAITFQMSPMRYVNRIRLQAVRYDLINTNIPLADIAENCGFCDQSHMTALFTRHYGVSPRRYRAARIDRMAVL